MFNEYLDLFWEGRKGKPAFCRAGREFYVLKWQYDHHLLWNSWCYPFKLWFTEDSVCYGVCNLSFILFTIFSPPYGFSYKENMLKGFVVLSFFIMLTKKKAWYRFLWHFWLVEDKRDCTPDQDHHKGSDWQDSCNIGLLQFHNQMVHVYVGPILQ